MSDNVNYAEFTEGFDSVKPDHGQAQGEAFESGWYPFKVMRAEVSTLPNTGVPVARLHLAVSEQCTQLRDILGGRRCFVDFFLGAGRTKTDYSNGKKEEYRLSESDFEKAKVETMGKVNAFVVGSLGVTPAKIPNANPADPNYITEFFKVKDWEGREFMGRITKHVDKTGTYGDKNRLQQYFAMDAAQYGYEWYMREKKGLAATIKAWEKASTGVKGGTVTAKDVVL